MKKTKNKVYSSILAADALGWGESARGKCSMDRAKRFMAKWPPTGLKIVVLLFTAISTEPTSCVLCRRTICRKVMPPPPGRKKLCEYMQACFLFV